MAFDNLSSLLELLVETLCGPQRGKRANARQCLPLTSFLFSLRLPLLSPALLWGPMEVILGSRIHLGCRRGKTAFPHTLPFLCPLDGSALWLSCAVVPVHSSPSQGEVLAPSPQEPLLCVSALGAGVTLLHPQALTIVCFLLSFPVSMWSVP